jgi:hypothetical protein
LQPFRREQERLLIRGENETGTATFLGVTATIIPSCVIDVRATSTPIEIWWGANLGVSTAGAGGIFLMPYDITMGVPTGPFENSGMPAGAVVSTVLGSTIGMCRLPASVNHRLIGLYGLVAREGGSGLVAYTRNLNGQGRTWIEAVLG